MKEIYLDEFVNMAVHHLVRRNSRDLLQFIWSKNLVRPSLGRLGVSPNTNTNLLLTLPLALFVTRVDFLNIQGRGGYPTLVHGQSGQAFLCSLFFFFFLFID